MAIIKRKFFITVVIYLASFSCFSQGKSSDTAKSETSYWQSLLVPALIAVIGYISKSVYEIIVEKEKRKRNLLEDKLKNFYWPILTRLEENNAIWKLILSKRQTRYQAESTTSQYVDDMANETQSRTECDSEATIPLTDGTSVVYGIENLNEIEKNIGLYVEENIVLKNHREIMTIIMTNRFLAKFDNTLSECLQNYFRHIAVYEGVLFLKENTFPGRLGAPYPKEFDEIIKKRTIELQQKLDKKTLL